ncbi:MAG: UDP-glucose 6-dehydrogenase [Candidatus Midichloriaceae bacterium]|jgi:UDPglucose 6-dehydrogenase|nr:UDP-glucose 6-dehydrogenase [Candidatus Midichloriaceae bacterium]
MKIAVIGVGYVGLVAGACFASFNMDVICIDQDEQKIDNLKNNIIPIYEPGLEEIVIKASKRGNLKFSSNLDDINDAEVVIIAVGTPSLPTGEANLSYLMKAIRDVAGVATGYKALVIKSTVPIGTANSVRNELASMGVADRFDVISNPEFLREGVAVYDFLKPDRIVIGANSQKARKIAETLYQPLTSQDVPLVITDNPTAETIKYAANAYLAMRVAYINQIADLCEAAGATIDDVAKGMGLDKRIGKHYLHAGPGYGGSCFPKDTKAISHIAKEKNVDLSIVEAVIAANDARKQKLVERIINAFRKHGCEKIAILGITFKAETDDMRDSASLIIVPALLKAEFEVRCYDPANPKDAHELLGVALQSSMKDALEGVDAALIITEWPEFQLFGLDQLAAKLNKKVLFDLRNLFDVEDIKRADISYYSIGRPDA